MFGIVSTHTEKDSLLCQYFKEGDGAKGGNNVASMLWNKFKLCGFVNDSESKGPLGEYNLVMDNCGGQNKNRMVIRLFLMMAELKIFKKVNLICLVCGHTKNACDRMFMLLKQFFHYKNLYTMKQLNDNPNKNRGVEAIELSSDVFFDFDKMLDKFYQVPHTGTVNRSHIFSMSSDKPGTLMLQDSTSSEIRIQHLRKGKDTDLERVIKIKKRLAEMTPMTKPGIRQIKQLELALKWRPLVPKEYQDDICPLPSPEFIADYREKINAKNRAKNPSTRTRKSKAPCNATLITDVGQFEKLKVVSLRDQLKLRGLPVKGKKADLLQRLKDNASVRVQALSEPVNVERENSVIDTSSTIVQQV